MTADVATRYNSAQVDVRSHGESAPWEQWDLLQVTWKTEVSGVFLRHLDRWIQLAQGTPQFDRETMLLMMQNARIERVMLVTEREFEDPRRAIITGIIDELERMK